MSGRGVNPLHLAVWFAVIAIGVAAAGYVLAKQGAPFPSGATYELDVELARANGVRPGVGQPVTVAGVRVGTISAVARRQGRAVVTVAIKRDELSTVHRDARATLTPISPLNDMQIVLDPGTAEAPALRDGDTLRIGATEAPLPPSAIIASLDSDTRQFLTSLLAALEHGTRGNGERIRRAIATLGPVTSQARELTEVLAARRHALSRLVSNLAVVSDAADADGELATVVQAGSATVGALASRDAQLREAIARLPSTLAHARTSLIRAADFSEQLAPTLDRLTPLVRRLPVALSDVASLSRITTPVLRRDVRPLTRELQPFLGSLRPTVATTTALSPQVTTIARALNYALNVVAFNPPGREDEGGLFWLSWFAHNVNSLTSVADAHGAIGRSGVLINCASLTNLADLSPVFLALVNAPNAC